MWQGLNATLIIPQSRHPMAAMTNPPAIQWFTVSRNWSNIPICSPLGNAKLGQDVDDALLVHEPDIPVNLPAFFIKEYLGGNRLYSVCFRRWTVYQGKSGF
jgi:hypothetical protein